MSKALVFGLAACLFAASSASAQVNLNQGNWGPAPAVFPKGAQMSVLSGDPTKPGIFVIRLKIPAGYQMPAHYHPADEYLTVVDGSVSLGMGNRLDKTKSVMLSTGAFVMAPARMNHYAFTSSGATLQILANGPFGMTYVNPSDDPRAH